MQTLNAARAKLTIIGIGSERTITATAANSQLFIINGDNATNITIQNVTLKGRSGYYQYLTDSYKVVHVYRGSLTMRDGSKITDSYGAVYVNSSNAVFKMEGGEISGNNNTYNASLIPSGVRICNGGIFEMSGGSITGYTTVYGTHALIIDDDNCTFRLSGSARIGTLMLHSYSASTRASVTIDGNYSGIVTILHLRGNNFGGDFALDRGAVANRWTNAPVIVNGSASVINMFNNSLGDFYTAHVTPSTYPISATHVLNAGGFLVLRED
jgi:hypothetical protein